MRPRLLLIAVCMLVSWQSSVHATPPCESQKLKPEDGAPGDKFALQIAADGALALMGAIQRR